MKIKTKTYRQYKHPIHCFNSKKKCKKQKTKCKCKQKLNKNLKHYFTKLQTSKHSFTTSKTCKLQSLLLQTNHAHLQKNKLLLFIIPYIFNPTKFTHNDKYFHVHKFHIHFSKSAPHILHAVFLSLQLLHNHNFLHFQFPSLSISISMSLISLLHYHHYQLLLLFPSYFPHNAVNTQMWDNYHHQ